MQLLNSIARGDATTALEVLLDILRTDPSPDVRMHAARVLAWRGNADDVPHLDDQIRSETDPAVRMEIVVAVDMIGGKAADDALVSLLADPDERIRARAATALSHRGDPDVAAALAAIAYGSDPLAAQAARSALAGSSSSQANPTALDALARARTEEEFLQAARDAASARDAPVRTAALDAMASALRAGDDSPATREEVIRILGRMPDREAYDLLRSHLTVEPDTAVRARAAIELARHGRTASAEDYRMLLAYEPEPEVRQAYVDSLATGMVPTGIALPLLRDRLATDGSSRVRAAAARALAAGVREETDHASILRTASEIASADDDEKSRSIAIGALALLGDRRAEPLLERLASQDPSPTISAQARAALNRVRQVESGPNDR